MADLTGVIKFDSPKEHYTADALIFWCFDARFSRVYDAFLVARGFAKREVDLVKFAGGAQALAGDEAAGAESATANTENATAKNSDKAFAESQIAKSIKLHHTTRVILTVHIDCGGYGGSQAFGGNHQKEWDHHVAELNRAASGVREKFPEIQDVEQWIVDFDGLYKISKL